MIYELYSLLVVRTALIKTKVSKIVNQRELWVQNQIVGVFDVMGAEFFEKKG